MKKKNVNFLKNKINTKRLACDIQFIPIDGIIN